MNNQQNNDNNQENKEKKKPSKFGLLNSISIGLLILLIVSVIYSAIASENKNTIKINLSELVSDVGAGNVTSITVKGDTLTATYNDEKKTVKETNKESDSSVTETFSRYGLTPEKLNAVKINVEGPSGFLFWFVQITPFLAPLLFIILIIWFL